MLKRCAVLLSVLLIGYSPYSLALNQDGLYRALAPYREWKRNFETYKRNAKEMRGVVLVSGGFIQKMDCKKMMLLVRPRIGGVCLVKFTSIQNVEITNKAAVPNFCDKSEWLSVGKRINIKGSFKYINKRNIIYDADLAPFNSDYFSND
jgi:hypothetical protein